MVNVGNIEAPCAASMRCRRSNFRGLLRTKDDEALLHHDVALDP